MSKRIKIGLERTLREFVEVVVEVPDDYDAHDDEPAATSIGSRRSGTATTLTPTPTPRAFPMTSRRSSPGMASI